MWIVGWRQADAMRWEGTDNDGPTPCIICGGFGSSFGAELRTFAGEYAAPTRSSAADEPAQLQTLSAEDTANGKRRTRQKDDKPSLDVYAHRHVHSHVYGHVYRHAGQKNIPEHGIPMSIRRLRIGAGALGLSWLGSVPWGCRSSARCLGAVVAWSRCVRSNAAVAQSPSPRHRQESTAPSAAVTVRSLPEMQQRQRLMHGSRCSRPRQSGSGACVRACLSCVHVMRARVRACVRACVHMSARPSVRLSVRPSLRLCIHASICTSVRPCVRPCVRVSVRPSIYTSVRPLVVCWLLYLFRV